MTWSNLFGVCMGAKAAQRQMNSTVIPKQGNAELHSELHPLFLKPGMVKFRRSGEVYSDQDEVNADLNQN